MGLYIKEHLKAYIKIKSFHQAVFLRIIFKKKQNIGKEKIRKPSFKVYIELIKIQENASSGKNLGKCIKWTIFLEKIKKKANIIYLTTQSTSTCGFATIQLAGTE